MENFINKDNIILNLETENKKEIINKMIDTISNEKLVDGKVVPKEEKKASEKTDTEKSSNDSSNDKSSDRSFDYSKVLVMNATSYTNDPSENGGYGTTRLGTPLRYGVVAVDPKVIPLGTKLYIEGYGYAVAEDTGGAIKGNRIDLCFTSRAQADNFGRRNVKVYILK